MKYTSLALAAVAALACASQVTRAADITLTNNSGQGKYITLLPSKQTVYLPGGQTTHLLKNVGCINVEGAYSYSIPIPGAKDTYSPVILYNENKRTRTLPCSIDGLDVTPTPTGF